jgi:transposase
MLTLPSAVRILLATEPVDMRKSIDGLMALVRNGWGEDVYSGHLFVFVSRRGERVKVLTFSRGGFILYYKRLETGRFRLPRVEEQGVLSAGVRERPWHQPVPSSALFIGPGETRWRDEV